MAGSIQKDHEQSNEFWTNEHLLELQKHLEPARVSFLNPAFRTDDLSDQKSVFGRDMLQVFSADVVLVDARLKRGLGVGAEMMWAKFHNIPVVSWAPKESHYNKTHAVILGVPVEHFVHPFVESLSDYIAETLLDAACYIQQVVNSPKNPCKGVTFIHEAMNHFIESGLASDLPMQEILSSNPYVRTKVFEQLNLERY